MKILFVLEHYHPYIGGVENLFTQLAQSLSKQGHCVQVVTTRHNKNLPTAEIINGVAIRRLKFSNRFLFTFFSIFHIIPYARRADFIHTTSYNAAFPAFFAALATRKKVIITFHEYWGKLWFQLPYLTNVERLLFSFYEWLIAKLPFYKVIAVSEYTNQCLSQKINQKKIHTIYNGVEHYNPIWVQPRGTFTYTYFGRLGVSKGLNLLLDAAELFSKQYPNSKLQLIIPKTPLKFYNHITNTIQQKKLSHHIQFFHELDTKTLQQVLLQSHCVVIPSYSEGFCFAAAESVALGIPIISSQKGALQEVVSGTYIEMQEHTAQGLLNALILAHNNKWIHSDIKKFKLSVQIEAFTAFYKNNFHLSQ